jgi:small subunit ribosomal protein S14
MAKKSQVARNEKRQKLVARYATRRAELVAVIKDAGATDDAKQDAYRQLHKLPRDSSATRVRNRCRVTGRARAYMRRFEMSRISFRELANQGKLPGVKKSSW